MVSEVLIINEVYLYTSTSAKPLCYPLSQTGYRKGYRWATDLTQHGSPEDRTRPLQTTGQPQGSKEKHRLLPLPLHTNLSSDTKADNMRLRFLFTLKPRSLINLIIFMTLLPSLLPLLQALLFCHCSPKSISYLWPQLFGLLIFLHASIPPN